MFKNFVSGDNNFDAPVAIPWLCYYGSDRNILSLPGYKLLVLEADALGSLKNEEKGERVCVAYMSIGEVSKSRWFWPMVQDKAWLLEDNPDWPGALRVDPRSDEWRDLLVNTIAPAFLAAGYDGFMLDNVDTGEYLENLEPAAYSGATDAAADIIRSLREKYPDAVIIANGGFDTLAEVSENLDAVICESAFSKWLVNEDGSISYVEISPQDKAWLRPRLLRLSGSGIPILSLDYVDPDDADASQRVGMAAIKAGYHPYMAERDLTGFPGNSGLTKAD